MTVGNTSVRCLLCEALLLFKDGTNERFEKHMRNEHEMSTNCVDFLVSIHFLSDNEKSTIVNRMKVRIDPSKGNFDNKKSIFQEPRENHDDLEVTVIKKEVGTEDLDINYIEKATYDLKAPVTKSNNFSNIIKSDIKDANEVAAKTTMEKLKKALVSQMNSDSEMTTPSNVETSKKTKYQRFLSNSEKIEENKNSKFFTSSFVMVREGLNEPRNLQNEDFDAV